MSYPLVEGSVCILPWCICHVAARRPGPELQAMQCLEAQGTELSDGY